MSRTAGDVVRVFVCELVTGGGLLGAPLPADLVAEAEAMVHALVTDLLAIEDVAVMLARDPRLPALDLPVTVITSPHPAEMWQRWKATLAGCDALWPIAPETGGQLERLSLMALATGARLLGSDPATVAIAASKRATAEVLSQSGLPVVSTLAAAPGLKLPPSSHGWVGKPDDGVGCAGIRLLPSIRDARRWLDQVGAPPGSSVIQPFLPGMAASLSLLCRDGRARLLAANRQRIYRDGNTLRYRGSDVGALDPQLFAPLAQGVAAALPGLWGYAGVDLVLTARGPVLLEVNPRLTTSYAGLHACLGHNPAALVLGLSGHVDADFPEGPGPRRAVPVALIPEHVA